MSNRIEIKEPNNLSEAAFQRWISAEEYLDFERNAEERHEYLNGQYYAMRGGGIKHSRISMNLSYLFVGHLRDCPCNAYSSNLRLHNLVTGSYFYPDLMVLCWRPIFKDHREDSIVNPRIVIEIFSLSSEKFDRNEKFMHYRTLDSLEVYVLVSQKEPKIEVYTRQRKNEPWSVEIFQGMDSNFTLAPIEFTAPLSEVYRNVEFPSDRLDT